MALVPQFQKSTFSHSNGKLPTFETMELVPSNLFLRFFLYSLSLKGHIGAHFGSNKIFLDPGSRKEGGSKSTQKGCFGNFEVIFPLIQMRWRKTDAGFGFSAPKLVRKHYCCSQRNFAVGLCYHLRQYDTEENK